MNLLLRLFGSIYNSKFLIFFVFIVSIICSCFFLFFLKNIGPAEHGTPGSDYFAFYQPMGENILKGKGLTFEGKVLPYIPPVFPFVLSGIFYLAEFFKIERLDLIVLFNILFAAGSCSLLFLIAKEIFNKKIALITAFLWMSYPFNLWFLKNPNTESIFIPLLYLGIFLYILALKRKKIELMFLGGIFLSLASLTRFISLFLPLLLAFFIFIYLTKESKKLNFFLVGVLLIGSFLAFSPWMVYTFLNSGSFIPFSAIGERVIVFGFNSLAESIGEKTIDLSGGNSNSLETIKEIEQLGGGFYTFHFLIKEFGPITFLKLFFLKIARCWYGTYKMWWEYKILAVQLLYLIPACFGSICSIIKIKEKRKEIIFIFILVIYFWIFAFLGGSILRYMVPVMGFVIIFMAVFLNFLINKILKKYDPICFRNNSLSE